MPSSAYNTLLKTTKQKAEDTQTKEICFDNLGAEGEKDGEGMHIVLLTYRTETRMTSAFSQKTIHIRVYIYLTDEKYYIYIERGVLHMDICIYICMCT